MFITGEMKKGGIRKYLFGLLRQQNKPSQQHSLLSICQTWAWQSLKKHSVSTLKMKRSENVILNLTDFWLDLKLFYNSFSICHKSQLLPLAMGRLTSNEEEVRCVWGGEGRGWRNKGPQMQADVRPGMPNTHWAGGGGVLLSCAVLQSHKD